MKKSSSIGSKCNGSGLSSTPWILFTKSNSVVVRVTIAAHMEYQVTEAGQFLRDGWPRPYGVFDRLTTQGRHRLDSLIVQAQWFRE